MPAIETPEKEILEDPYINTGGRSSHIKNFLRLNYEIKGISGILMPAVINPDPLLAKEEQEKALRDSWARYYKSFAEWMEQLWSAIRDFYTESIKNLSDLEDELSEKIELLKDTEPALAEKLIEAREDVQALKQEAQTRKTRAEEGLENAEPISRVAFEDMEGEATVHASLTSRLFDRARDIYARFNRPAETSFNHTTSQSEQDDNERSSGLMGDAWDDAKANSSGATTGQEDTDEEGETEAQKRRRASEEFRARFGGYHPN